VRLLTERVCLSQIPNNLRTWGLRILHDLRLATFGVLLVLVGALSSWFRTRAAVQLENLAFHRCHWARMRPNRDRRNRRRRGESWQFRRSAGSTIATNAGPPENDSRGCSHFAGRSVSGESLPDGQHREDAVRTADHFLFHLRFRQ